MSVAARLIGGVGHVPIKLSSMTEPVSSAPEAVNWLQTVQTDEGAIELMNATLANADEVCSQCQICVLATKVKESTILCCVRTLRRCSQHRALLLLSRNCRELRTALQQL